MCIGEQICTELGDNPKTWSRHAPLLPPAWFDGELNAFAEAVRSAAAGDLDKARLQLTVVRSDDLRSWYGDHGEKAGYFRCPHFGGRRKRPSPPILDPIRDTRSQEELVYKRDGYRCRYCSLRVIPGVVLRLLSRVVGVESFCMTGPRSRRHGAAVAFRACADHVVHHASGGLTNPKNLVTACWSCNFAKVD